MSMAFWMISASSAETSRSLRVSSNSCWSLCRITVKSSTSTASLAMMSLASCTAFATTCRALASSSANLALCWSCSCTLTSSSVWALTLSIAALALMSACAAGSSSTRTAAASSASIAARARVLSSISAWSACLSSCRLRSWFPSRATNPAASLALSSASRVDAWALRSATWLAASATARRLNLWIASSRAWRSATRASSPFCSSLASVSVSALRRPSMMLFLRAPAPLRIPTSRFRASLMFWNR